jgi:hypothetical protein
LPACRRAGWGATLLVLVLKVTPAEAAYLSVWIALIGIPGRALGAWLSDASLQMAGEVLVYLEHGHLVLVEYVVPVRAGPNVEIRIRAGDVHKAMQLSGRMPAVCGALDSMIFRREFGLELVGRTGPHQGANVEFRFRIAKARSDSVHQIPMDPSAQTSVSVENDEGASLLRTTTGKQRFTLRGETFEKERHDFVAAMMNRDPGRIQKYSTVINGERYPIRQVVSSATGLPPIAITSQEAYRILEKFGFIVEMHE